MAPARKAPGFRYPFATRSLRSPLDSPLEMAAPGARLAPSNGVLPCPRNAVPAPESKIENGSPLWKIETPLTCHPPNAVETRCCAGRKAVRRRSSPTSDAAG